MRPAFVLAVIHYCTATLAQSPNTPDWPDSLFSGIGLAEELNIRARCKKGFSAFRLLEFQASEPLGLVAVTVMDGERTVSSQLFSNGTRSSSVTESVSKSEWVAVQSAFRSADFWSFEPNSTVWMPESLSWLIEGCADGTYHVATLYPEIDYRLNTPVEVLLELVP